MKTIKNLIVGAGIAGLTLARELRDESTFVLEKSQGVGGRMATRRSGDFTFDHGAQFYPSCAPTPIESHWQKLEILSQWFINNDGVYKSAKGGMTKLAKSLVPPSQILLNHLVETISPVFSPTQRGWKVSVKSGSDFFAERVFLTCPLPQSLLLMARSKLSYPEALEEVKYQKALVGLFGLLEDEKLLDEINFLDNVSDEIYSIANQRSKGVSSRAAFTVTMQPSWSDVNFDKPDDIIIEKIEFGFTSYLKNHFSMTVNPVLRMLKKWRYRQPIHAFDIPFVEPHPNLYLLGDAFSCGEANIFGAMQSALATAKNVGSR